MGSHDTIFVSMLKVLHAKAYPNHDKFINKKIEMSLVCGNDRARGDCAKSFEDIDFYSFFEKDDDNELEGPSIEKNVQVTEASQIKSSRKRKSSFEVQDVIGDISIKFGEEATTIGRMIDSRQDVTKLYEEVMAIEEFTAAFTTFAQSVTAQNERPVVVLANPDIAHTWYKQWKPERPYEVRPIEWEDFVTTFLDRFFPQEMKEAKIERKKIKMREKQNKRARTGSFNFAQPKSERGNHSQFCPKSSVLAPSSASAPASKFRDGNKDRVFYVHVYALLDPVASLSFVTPYIVVDFGVSPKILAELFLVSTLVGKTIIARQFQFLNKPILEWKGSVSASKGQLVSYLWARKMISKGCFYHLVQVKDTSSETPSLESIPVVHEYSDIFSEDLPGISFKREIDFGIDLLPDTHPISIPPYKMVAGGSVR
ncbi:hypothetical protein FXO38_07556 [Capsicum annuum]|nr:hypothetical protein FXO38_07556 [Capsicum annuum]